jgi:putative transposase
MGESMDCGVEVRRRRSGRLKGFDYSRPGAYFVTACTHVRSALLGEVVDGGMQLNDCGRIVSASWHDLPHHYPHVRLDAFVVMPNHIHGVIVLVEDTGLNKANVGAGFKPAPTGRARRHGLPEVVRALKTFSSRRINELRGTRGTPVWQRGYYERVVRSEEELNRIREYIGANPERWLEDRYHPSRSAVG